MGWEYWQTRESVKQEAQKLHRSISEAQHLAITTGCDIIFAFNPENYAVVRPPSDKCGPGEELDIQQYSPDMTFTSEGLPGDIMRFEGGTGRFTEEYRRSLKNGSEILQISIGNSIYEVKLEVSSTGELMPLNY